MSVKTITAIYRELKFDYYGSEKNIFDKEHYFFRWYRPLSFFPSAILIKYGISANTVTFFGSICLFAAFACFTLGYFILGAFLYLLAYIVDFMDGNIARYSGHFSYFGKMIDGWVDSWSFLLFVAAGIGNSLGGHSIIDPVTDVFLGIATGFAICIRNYFHLRLAYIFVLVKARGESAESKSNLVSKRRNSILHLGKRFYFGMISGMPVLLVLAVSLNVVTLYLAFYFCASILATIFEIVYGLRRVWLLQDCSSFSKK